MRRRGSGTQASLQSKLGSEAKPNEVLAESIFYYYILSKLDIQFAIISLISSFLNSKFSIRFAHRLNGEFGNQIKLCLRRGSGTQASLQSKLGSEAKPNEVLAVSTALSVNIFQTRHSI